MGIQENFRLMTIGLDLYFTGVGDFLFFGRRLSKEKRQRRRCYVRLKKLCYSIFGETVLLRFKLIFC